MKKVKIIFLDYDGVVNIPMWGNYAGIFKCAFNKPEDGRVNDYQALCWLNELHRLIDYKIVVSSSWRFLCKDVSYSNCLYNSGLDKNIDIIGCIPILPSRNKSQEINQWLKENKNIVDDYVVLDDLPSLENHNDRLIRCNYNHGFGAEELKRVIRKFKE